jgi:hypothetical protein
MTCCYYTPFFEHASGTMFGMASTAPGLPASKDPNANGKQSAGTSSELPQPITNGKGPSRATPPLRVVSWRRFFVGDR